jgi:hypothetical protein
MMILPEFSWVKMCSYLLIIAKLICGAFSWTWFCYVLVETLFYQNRVNWSLFFPLTMCPTPYSKVGTVCKYVSQYYGHSWWHAFERLMGAVLVKGRTSWCFTYLCSLVCWRGSVCDTMVGQHGAVSTDCKQTNKSIYFAQYITMYLELYPDSYLDCSCMYALWESIQGCRPSTHVDYLRYVLSFIVHVWEGITGHGQVKISKQERIIYQKQQPVS